MKTITLALLGCRIAALGAASMGNISAAEQPQTLASCSLRYGYLMADHWLTVDLAQQIERGLSYSPRAEAGGRRSEWKALRQSLTVAEQKLSEARDLYRGLFAASSAEGVVRLSQLLNQVAAAEAENEKHATALLQALGEQSSQGQFRAVPVTKEELASAWDGPQMIDRSFRPRRILFGSTGRVGDDRTLPLRFDFGNGMFGFYIPMTAQDRLEIAENVSGRTAPEYAWMKSHRSGYHYWAGVYNNQNTYLAPWFLQQHQEEDDVWMKLANGKLLKGGSWGQANVWNPHVRSYLVNYCEVQARTLSSDPFLVCYDYTAEPHPFGAQAPGQPQYSGYNVSAIQAFQDSLRAKYGRISDLNTAWQTQYAGFEAIQPPADPYVSPPGKATALSYEFGRFRSDSHARLWKLLYDAYRRQDPAKPVAANAGMFMSGWPVEGLDPYQLQKMGVADWVDMHMNNFWPNLAEQVYLYSLCRLSGKIPVEFEYIWTFPRTGPFDDANENDFRATCQASVWRNLVWGKKALVFYDFYYDWPSYHNAFLDRDLGYSILRPSACVVPTMKRKALRFSDILLRTEVATPPLIVLEPTASILNSPPMHPNQSFSFHTGVAGKEVHELLFPKNYPFLYVPEAAVLDGYPLGQHRVVILPQAPYLPESLTDRLLAWVEQGGTLISVGIPGIWNPHGRDDLRLVSRMFGPSQVSEKQPGKWTWRWQITQTSPGIVRQVRNAQGELVAALTTWGKGRALVSTGPFDNAELQSLFYQVLDQAIGKRPATCEHDSFELVLREDSHGRRFLFILNPHTRETREDRIILAGRYPTCTDLGIGSGVPLPVSAQASETTFRLRLYPGEGTVISLSR